MKWFCHILLLLLTLSWFSSLVEVLPCDNEFDHGSDITALSSSPFHNPTLEPAAANDQQTHDCHGGACHFGHCAHGYPKALLSFMDNSIVHAMVVHTPYSSLAANGSPWPLIRPPRSHGSSHTLALLMTA